MGKSDSPLRACSSSDSSRSEGVRTASTYPYGSASEGGPETSEREATNLGFVLTTHMRSGRRRPKARPLEKVLSHAGPWRHHPRYG